MRNLSDKSKVDSLLSQLKNHKALSFLVVLGVVVIALANVTQAIEKLTQFGKSVYSFAKPALGESDLATVVQVISKQKTGGSKAAYEALREYLRNRDEDFHFILRPMDFDDNLLANTVGGITVVSTVGQYKIEGFVIFIDSASGRVVLVDSEYPLGVRNIKVIEDTGGSPRSLIMVRYISITGAGTFGESVKVYALDKGGVHLALDKPYSEVNSGWNAFESETVEFRTRNDLRLRNGVVEIQSSGVVLFGNDGDQFRELPGELYLWDPRSREFEQILGRKTSPDALMTTIYSDFANPKGEWFEKPQSVDRTLLRQVFIEEDW